MTSLKVQVEEEEGGMGGCLLMLLPDDLAVLAGDVQLEHVTTLGTLDELERNLQAETSVSQSAAAAAAR